MEITSGLLRQSLSHMFLFSEEKVEKAVCIQEKVPDKCQKWRDLEIPECRTGLTHVGENYSAMIGFQGAEQRLSHDWFGEATCWSPFDSSTGCTNTGTTFLLLPTPKSPCSVVQFR